MASTGPLSHIDISVGYPEASIPFYHAFFSALGFTRWNIDDPEWAGDNPRRATWSIRNPDGSRFGVEVRPAQEDLRDRKYNRYAPGPHHIAFHAGSEEEVDAVHDAIVLINGRVLDPPHQYGGESGYGDHYYAAFFADPDGVKLEVCCIRTENP
jgi:catechol 2,3-dioxygenase-like lactoylglutathione lyase family enzyme